MLEPDYDAGGNCLVDHVLKKMSEKIKQGETRGGWLENISQWNYHPNFLIPRKLFHPVRSEWLEDSFEEQSFELSMPMSPEHMKKATEKQLRSYLEQARAFRNNIVKWLLDAPKVVDFEKHTQRWPLRLDFTYSGSGQQIKVKLTSHAVKLLV